MVQEDYDYSNVINDKLSSSNVINYHHFSYNLFLSNVIEQLDTNQVVVVIALFKCD